MFSLEINILTKGETIVLFLEKKSNLIKNKD